MELEKLANYFDGKLVAKALDAVEHRERINALASRNRLPQWQADVEVRKLEEAFRDPKLKSVAEDISHDLILRSYSQFQRNLQYSNKADLQTLAAAGLLGAAAQEIEGQEAYQDKVMDRRGFLKSAGRSVQRTLEEHPLLKFALPGTAYVLTAACGGGNGGRNNGGNPTGPGTIYLDGISGTVKELIKEGTVDGTIAVDGSPTPISIQGGRYTITAAHQLLAGRKNLTIRTNQGYTRMTSADLTTQGFSINNGDGRIVLLDVVGNNDITGQRYSEYQRIGMHHEGGTGYRWLQDPRKFLYDISLFQSGVNFTKSGEEPMNPTFKRRVLEVFANDFSIASDGFLTGNFLLESESSERPGFGGSTENWITTGMSPQLQPGYAISLNYNRKPDGGMRNGLLVFDKRFDLPRTSIARDVIQLTGVYRDNRDAVINGPLVWESVGPDGRPNDLVRYMGKIKYNRKGLHNSQAVPDQQS